MFELNAGYYGLSARGAVWKVGKQYQYGRTTCREVLGNSKSSPARVSSRLFSVSGVENLAIIEATDPTQVAEKNNSQDVKNIVAKLEMQSREEKNLHRRVVRSSSWYDTIVRVSA